MKMQVLFSGVVFANGQTERLSLIDLNETPSDRILAPCPPEWIGKKYWQPIGKECGTEGWVSCNKGTYLWYLYPIGKEVQKKKTLSFTCPDKNTVIATSTKIKASITVETCKTRFNWRLADRRKNADVRCYKKCSKQNKKMTYATYDRTAKSKIFSKEGYTSRKRCLKAAKNAQDAKDAQAKKESKESLTCTTKTRWSVVEKKPDSQEQCLEKCSHKQMKYTLYNFQTKIYKKWFTSRADCLDAVPTTTTTSTTTTSTTTTSTTTIFSQDDVTTTKTTTFPADAYAKAPIRNKTPSNQSVQKVLNARPTTVTKLRNADEMEAFFRDTAPRVLLEHVDCHLWDQIEKNWPLVAKRMPDIKFFTYEGVYVPQDLNSHAHYFYKPQPPRKLSYEYWPRLQIEEYQKLKVQWEPVDQIITIIQNADNEAQKLS